MNFRYSSCTHNSLRQSFIGNLTKQPYQVMSANPTCHAGLVHPAYSCCQIQLSPGACRRHGFDGWSSSSDSPCPCTTSSRPEGVGPSQSRRCRGQAPPIAATMRAASSSPAINVDDFRRCSHSRPMKYKPGTSVKPFRCSGYPPPSRTGTSRKPKSGR